MLGLRSRPRSSLPPRSRPPRRTRRIGLTGLTISTLLVAPLAAPVLTAALPTAAQAITTELADVVDPFIGTKEGTPSYAKGATFPGAVVPFGMTAISPDTDSRYAGGYKSGASKIEGFSQNHISGTGCSGDFGNILLAPTVGSLTITEADYKSSYANEAASAGYYKVDLTTPGVTAEMTATTRTTASRYTFPARTGDANMIVDVSHGLTSSRGGTVTVNSTTEVEGRNDAGGFCGRGSRYSVYFVARFSKAATSTGTWTGTTTGTDATRTGSNIGAYMRFTTTANEQIEVRVGLSYVSVANARANLDAEAPSSKTFADLKSAARTSWNTELGKIAVEGGTDDQRKIFYTALYHMLIHPSTFSDTNGQYRGIRDSGTKTATGYTQYHLFSLWDTYRAQHTLLSLVYPERQLDMVKSMVAHYKDGGWLPKWELAGSETKIMVGDSAAPVITDTYLKGITGFDVDSAYAAMKKSATQTSDNPLRPGLADYIDLGFIPHDNDEVEATADDGPVSVAQEYYYDDWNIAKLATALGKTDDATTFQTRAGQYTKLYDSSTGFFRSKYENGTWLADFDPECCKQNSGKYIGPGYVEGNAYQYQFFIPHDVPGMKSLMGGDAGFVKKLDKTFTSTKYYTLINEPDLHYPYLYDFVDGQAWRTQQQVRKDLSTGFKATRDGLPGNDDAGATSAVFVFGAMGFYPVAPASNDYQIGSPIFDKVTIALNDDFYADNVSFVVQADSNSSTNKFVQSATLNGSTHSKTVIKHSEIVAGGTLRLAMGPSATSWPKSSDYANIAWNRPATADSSCATTEGPEKAVDGSLTKGSGKWCSQGTSGSYWLQIDLGSSFNVSRFVLKNAGAAGESSSYNTRGFTIKLGSSCSSFGDPVVTVTDNTANTVTKTITSTAATCVRLDVTQPQQSGTGGAARIYEFEVYGQ